MTEYYCPYCSPQHQLHKRRSDGVMICGHCHDPLIKVQLIKLKQVIALIATLAFIAPLILMVSTYIKDSNRPELKKALQHMAVLSKSINLSN